jgi:hypothetical protein
VNPELTLLIIAAVLSLPGGLFMSFIMSAPRAKALSLLGGIIGAAVVGAGVYFFIIAGQVSVDMLSYGLGAFFACSMGVFAGALLVNFLVGLTSRGSDLTPQEF